MRNAYDPLSFGNEDQNDEGNAVLSRKISPAPSYSFNDPLNDPPFRGGDGRSKNLDSIMSPYKPVVATTTTPPTSAKQASSYSDSARRFPRTFSLDSHADDLPGGSSASAASALSPYKANAPGGMEHGSTHGLGVPSPVPLHVATDKQANPDADVAHQAHSTASSQAPVPRLFSQPASPSSSSRLSSSPSRVPITLPKNNSAVLTTSHPRVSPSFPPPYEGHAQDDPYSYDPLRNVFQSSSPPASPPPPQQTFTPSNHNQKSIHSFLREREQQQQQQHQQPQESAQIATPTPPVRLPPPSSYAYPSPPSYDTATANRSGGGPDSATLFGTVRERSSEDLFSTYTGASTGYSPDPIVQRTIESLPPAQVAPASRPPPSSVKDFSFAPSFPSASPPPAHPPTSAVRYHQETTASPLQQHIKNQQSESQPRHHRTRSGTGSWHETRVPGPTHAASFSTGVGAFGPPGRVSSPARPASGSDARVSSAADAATASSSAGLANGVRSLSDHTNASSAQNSRFPHAANGFERVSGSAPLEQQLQAETRSSGHN